MYLILEKNLNSKDITVNSFSKLVKLGANFEIELDVSLNCKNYWIKIFDQDYLRINGSKQLNGPQIGSYFDKEIIEFQPLKKGEIEISFIEISNLEPYRKIKYDLKIVS